MGDIRQVLIGSGVVVLAALILAAPMLLYGAPFLWFDSADFMIVGRDWLDARNSIPRMDAPFVPMGDDYRSLFELDNGLVGTLIAARSPVYAAPFAFLFSLSQFAVGLVQCLVLAVLLVLAARLFLGRFAPLLTLALAAAMTALTTLPFVAAFGMPDIFGGAAALACVLAAFFWSDLKLPARIGLFLLIAYACAAHGANPPLVAAAAALSLAAGWLLRGPALKPATLIAAALVAGLAANATLTAWIEAGPGRLEVAAPPFIAARVIADGEGRDYLREACPGAGYALCAFKDLPLDNSDRILWSDAPDEGVFRISPPPVREALQDEENQFVLDLAKAKPLPLAFQFAKNTIRQAIGFSAATEADMFLRHAPALPDRRDAVMLAKISRNAECARADAACTLSIGWLDAVHYAVVGAAAVMALIVWILAAGRILKAGWKTARTALIVRAAVLLAFVAALLLVNAAVCGGLSGPFNRYQARIVWLLPLIAGLVAATAARKPSPVR